MVDKPEWKDKFRFQMVEQHKTAFTRQLSECLRMKNSPAIIMNLKYEYTGCVIPDLPLSDRGWIKEGPQRQSAKIDYPQKSDYQDKIQKKQAYNQTEDQDSKQ